MLFIKSNSLKTGMRLARPIYNKNGVLLYERNSKLTEQGITSIKNFGLIGIFILEPAEPVPPMTKDDIEFERFQTMCVFAIQEELTKMKTLGKAPKMQVVAGNIIRNYGRKDKKVNFIQDLRSKEDYIYKHSLNVAILCALMTHALNVRLEEQLDTVIAAVVHDIGKLTLPKEFDNKVNFTDSDRDVMRSYEVGGYNIIENVFTANPGIKRICMQTQKELYDFHKGKISDKKLVIGAKILIAAETYDVMTAMQFEQEPASEVSAIRFLMENPEVFDSNVIDSLIRSINILSPGTCIELNTGDKGLVLAQNEEDVLRPMILNFRDNSILDLGNELIYGDIEIKDIMKTMDNRYIMDTSVLKKQGIHFEEPEYVEVSDDAEEYVPGRDF